MTKRNFKSAKNFQRPKAKHPGKETILIVCEGETEVNYFNALKKHYRLHSLTAQLSVLGSAPINVAKYAIE